MDTPHLVPIARAADIAEGAILRVADTPAGPLAIVRLEDGYHALRDRCPHAAARLSEGFIDGRALVCPTHFAAFDVVTGIARDAPKSCPAVPIFVITEQSGWLYLAVQAGHSDAPCSKEPAP